MTVVSVIFGFVFICCLQLTIQTPLPITKNASYYTAGVVEFRPAQFEYSTWTPRAQLQDNLKGYIEIITSRAAKETDIIVFPEMTLNGNEEATFVPDPTRVLSSPCDDVTNESGEKYHDFLISLSCLAKKVSKYVVINVCEKDYCELQTVDPRPCANSGFNIFNTNVVFDRNGVVVSRYRKVHLWGEPRNTSFLPSLGYFDTDFGVRFGHFVCFDLLFYMPAQEMVQKMGIRDFIFPTMWFSQLPFLTGVQIQSAWSYANDVNFLAAGASFPLVGTTGTGIYAGRQGALHSVMSRNNGQRKLYVAQLQKTPPTANRTRMKRDVIFEKIKFESRKHRTNDEIYLKRDYLEEYRTLSISLTDGKSLRKQLCQRNDTTNSKFCCDFDLQWTEEVNNGSNVSLFSEKRFEKRYHYRLGVFNGLRKEEAPESNFLRNCALIACVGPKIADCGKVFDYETPTRVVFERLAIEATFPNTSEFLLMPSSLKEDLLPVHVKDFQWQEFEEGNSRKVRYALKRPVSNLLTFSIYGNYYDSNAIDEQNACNNEDVGDPYEFCDDSLGKDGATALIISVQLIVSCFMVTRF